MKKSITSILLITFILLGCAHEPDWTTMIVFQEKPIINFEKLSNQSNLEISIESISPKEILTQTKYSKDLFFNHAHYNYFFYIKSISPSNTYFLKNKREVLGKKYFFTCGEESSYEILMERSKLLGCDTYPILINGIGYLPGEEVEFLIHNQDETEFARFTLVPNPVIVHSKVDNAEIEASICSINPTAYIIKFDGFEKGEKIKQTSISNGVILQNDIIFSNKVVVIHCPEVISSDKGINKIHFDRENKERLTINLPWGRELMEHITGKRNPMNYE